MPTALAQTHAKKRGGALSQAKVKKITYSLARTKTKIRRWRHKHRKHVQKKQLDYNGGDWSVTDENQNNDTRSFAPIQRPRRGKVIPLEYLSATHQRPINFIGKAFEDAPFIYFFFFFALLVVRGRHRPEIPDSIRQCAFKQAQAAVDELVLLCRLYHAAPENKNRTHEYTCHPSTIQMSMTVKSELAYDDVRPLIRSTKMLHETSTGSTRALPIYFNKFKANIWLKIEVKKRRKEVLEVRQMITYRSEEHRRFPRCRLDLRP
jgi:hypothetical protein